MQHTRSAAAHRATGADSVEWRAVAGVMRRGGPLDIRVLTRTSVVVRGSVADMLRVTSDAMTAARQGRVA